MINHHKVVCNLISVKRFNKKLNKIKRKGERQKAKYELESRYEKYYPHKNGKKVSNIMLVIIVFSIVAYTVASFWLAYATGVSIDSTLTTCFYAFWTVEILALAGIRVSKVRKEARNGSDYMYNEEEIGYEEESG